MPWPQYDLTTLSLQQGECTVMQRVASAFAQTPQDVDERCQTMPLKALLDSVLLLICGNFDSSYKASLG